MVAALNLVSCSDSTDFKMTPLSFEDLPGWESEDFGSLLSPLQDTCHRLISMGEGASRKVCEQALALPNDPKQIKAFFEAHYIPHRVHSTSSGLFTGYFQPVLTGSRTRNSETQVPVYPKPDDLLIIEDLGDFNPDLRGYRWAGRLENGKLVPYPTRAEISQGALEGRCKPVLWLDDPVDAFFMHIQGSGIVKLDTGESVGLAYAGANGHLFIAIGKILIGRGDIPRAEISMQSIQAWLQAHPEQAQDLMHQNASYIFFKEVAADAPRGSYGVPLIPGRSLAVDKKYIPLGTVLWVDIESPKEKDTRLQHLMFAHDTGSAIKGAIRGDYYWGQGDEAGTYAGGMKSGGTYYVLLPKGEVTG